MRPVEDPAQQRPHQQRRHGAHRVEETDPPLRRPEVGEVAGGVDQEREAEFLEERSDEEPRECVAETPEGHDRATVTAPGGHTIAVDRDPAVETRWAPATTFVDSGRATPDTRSKPLRAASFRT